MVSRQESWLQRVRSERAMRIAQPVVSGLGIIGIVVAAYVFSVDVAVGIGLAAVAAGRYLRRRIARSRA